MPTGGKAWHPEDRLRPVSWISGVLPDTRGGNTRGVVSEA